ncbi:Protein takeout, partial [Armadillidium nasatum]
DFRVKECRDNLNSLDSCLSDILEDIKPLLSQGLPDLNIPILEPVLLETLEFAQQEGPVNIRARLKDVHVSGISNFTLQLLKTDLTNNEIKVKVHLPVLRVQGNYVLQGNLLLLPVTGEGPFRAVLRDINAALIGQIVVKDRGQGQQTLGVDNTRINFRLEKARVRLHNLFNGDELLGQTVNHFINNNDQLILNEVKPALSRDIALLIEGVLDSALSTLPAELLSLPADLL